MSLHRRTARLEAKTKRLEAQRRPPGRLALEIRAIDAEIARIERELMQAGVDPYALCADNAFEPIAGETLEERIARIEAEIAEEEGEGVGS